MLRYKEGGDTLCVEASGQLTRGDHHEFTRRLEALAQECGKVRVLCELKDLKGVEASSIWNGSASRLRDKGFVARFAVVGDEKEAPWMRAVAEPFTEVKFFSTAQRQEAIRWVAEGGEEAHQEHIRRRAYAKWEAAGRPDGDGRFFWLEAERELQPMLNVGDPEKS